MVTLYKKAIGVGLVSVRESQLFVNDLYKVSSQLKQRLSSEYITGAKRSKNWGRIKLSSQSLPSEVGGRF